MAENWIKVRKSLKSDIRIIGRARTMGVSHNELLGAMVSFFCWADEHTADGNLPGLTIADLDEPLVSGLPGFGDAMVNIGWITVNDDGLMINGFDDHMSKSAKKRAQSAKRTSLSRSCNAASVTEALPDRDKKEIREEKSKRGTPPNPPSGFDWSSAPAGMDTPEVRAAFERWSSYRQENRWGAWKSQTIDAKLNEYQGRPGDLIADMERSIANGWRGIFPDKAKGANHAKQSDSFNHPEDTSWITKPKGGAA